MKKIEMPYQEYQNELHASHTRGWNKGQHVLLNDLLSFLKNDCKDHAEIWDGEELEDKKLVNLISKLEEKYKEE